MSLSLRLLFWLTRTSRLTKLGYKQLATTTTLAVRQATLDHETSGPGPA
jgi:hypothetical protein